MKKILMFLMLGMFMVSMVSAEEVSLGIFKVNEQVEIIQICNNDTSLCDSCNLSSVKYPNFPSIITSVSMTKRSGDFNYTLTNKQVNQTGILLINGFCETASQVKVFSFTATITKTGTLLSTGEAIIYILLTLAIFSLFLIIFYFMIRTPYGNDINEKGAVIKITKLKYVKLGLIMLSWVLFIWFLNLLIAVSDNFVTLTMYYGFVSFMFSIMMRLSLPLGIFIIVLSFFEIIKDVNIQENIRKFGSAR